MSDLLIYCLMKAMISRARQNNYLPSMKLCDRVRESDCLSVRLSASKSWWYYSGFTGMLSILWHCWLGGIRSVKIWLLVCCWDWNRSG